MSFKTRPVPLPYTQPYNASSCGSIHQSLAIPPPHDLIRLQHERDVLSKGLADCVTYLKAMREKQIVNARQLSKGSSLPQKKRKRLQQTKRRLDSEIKNRERDEQAFLNNLQACETNIFLVNIKAYHVTNLLVQASESTSTPTLYTPTVCSHSGSETTDLTWDGWTDEAVVSPLQKRSNNPFFVDDVAPEACVEDHRRDSAAARDVKRPHPLSRSAAHLSNSLLVPPNTAQSRSSALSPAATIFEPNFPITRYGSSPEAKFKRLSMSKPTASNVLDLLRKRRFSAAEAVPVSRRFYLDAWPVQHLQGTTWRNTAPQASRQKSAGAQTGRHRTNSL